MSVMQTKNLTKDYKNFVKLLKSKGDIMKKVICICLAAFLMLLCSCSSATAQTIDDEVKSVPVETITASMSSIESTKSFSGNISAAIEVPIISLASGQVDSVKVSVGDKVVSGQVLATVDQPNVESQIKQASNALKLAKANRSSANETKNRINEEISKLNDTITKAQQAIIDMTALISADPTVTEEERIFRLNLLNPSLGSILTQQIDADYLNGKIDIKQYTDYLGLINIAGAPGTLTAAKKTLEAQLAALPSDTVLKSQVDSAQIALDMAQLLKSNCEITSTINGTVSSVNIVTGGVVSSASPAFVIIDTSSYYLEVPIAEEDLPIFKDITNIDVLVQDKQYFGMLTYVSPSTNLRTGAYSARISILDNSLTAGMFAKFSLKNKMAQDVIVIPNSAIVADLAQRYVFVVENGIAKRKAIEVGFSDGTNTEILSGILAGEQVVVKGASFLSDNVTVVTGEGQ